MGAWVGNIILGLVQVIKCHTQLPYCLLYGYNSVVVIALSSLSSHDTPLTEHTVL